MNEPSRLALADRPYRLQRMILTVCGRCLEEAPARELDYERDILQGDLVEQDGRVLLRRHCRRGHGEVVSLYEEDAALWASFQSWRVPTRWHTPDTAGDDLPVPMGYARGLGSLQEQHTCVLLTDITQDCDIACPVCFAACRPGVDRYARPKDILRSLDAVLEREGGHLDLVMLSGGEPTLHPELITLLDAVLERSVTRVVLNTNGIRVARDDGLLAALADRRKRVEVYLGYDGPARETYTALRGADLVRLKEAALARLSSARVFTTLACTVAAGVNEDAVGAVLDTALATAYVGGVVYQPLFGAPVRDPMDRVTSTGVLRRLEVQTAGRLRVDDFVPLPCSHPDCSTLTYLLQTDGGAWRSLPDLVGRERIREHLGLVGNRLVPDDAMWGALMGLLSGSMTVGRDELLDHLGTLTGACRLDLGGLARLVGHSILGRRQHVEDVVKRVKRISVKGFMDHWTLNVERLRQCCTHVPSLDPDAPVVRIPFCARNTLPGLRAHVERGLLPVIDFELVMPATCPGRVADPSRAVVRAGPGADPSRAVDRPVQGAGSSRVVAGWAALPSRAAAGSASRLLRLAAGSGRCRRASLARC